jgi:hypothetical protein
MSFRRLSRIGPLAALAAALALSVAGCSVLDQKQREWIFQPSDRTWSGGLAAAEGMQDVWIEFDARTGDAPARLHGLWLPQAHAGAPLLLYLHGARWDVRGSAPRMRRLHELGFSVLGIDYRGFGRSEGSELPSEAMAYEDARAAWDWLGRQAPGARRFVFGHSLGGAIAVDLAAHAPDVAGLMVEGSFTSIPDLLGSLHWSGMSLAPLGMFVTQRFDAAARIDKVRSPVLVVHGSDDRLVPPEVGHALYRRAPEPKRFVLVQGGSHHSTNSVGIAQYRSAVRELFGLVEPADPVPRRSTVRNPPP